MPISPEIRPATEAEVAEITWRPSVRISKKKENPVLTQVLRVLEENPVVVIAPDQPMYGEEWSIARNLRKSAKEAGIHLNVNTDPFQRRIYVRKDPKVGSVTVV